MKLLIGWDEVELIRKKDNKKIKLTDSSIRLVGKHSGYKKDGTGRYIMLHISEKNGKDEIHLDYHRSKFQIGLRELPRIEITPERLIINNQIIQD